MKLTLKFSLVVLLLIGGAMQVEAQESKYQALYIYNFTKHINFSNTQVTIGVIGNSPTLQELETLAKRDPQKLKIIKISESGPIAGCDIVFIPEAQEKNFVAIQSKVSDTSVILISESESLITRGAEIAFYKEDNKLKFVLNKSAIDHSQLQISNALLSMAKVVN